MRQFLIGVMIASLAAPAHAADVKPAGMAIAAVVGEEAISSYDVESRVRFVIVSTQLSNTPEVLERIRPQVIRALIDERLQLQEAAKYNVEIAPSDIDKATASIEQQRGMPAGAIERLLSQHNIPKDTYTQQIRAQLAWGKLLNKKVRPQLRVSDEEIALSGQKLAVPKLLQELEIALIVLPIDKPGREAEIKRLGDKLVGEMRAKASFEEVARQFSSGSAGKVERFWVRPQQLDPVIARALANAKAGDITEPLHGKDGFTIIKVYTTRELEKPEEQAVEVTLKEILLRLKADASHKEANVLLAIGEEVAKNPGTCDEKGVAGITAPEDFAIEVNQLKGRLSELPAALRAIASNLAVGDISPPFASRDGIKLYMLCAKQDVPAGAVDRERVYSLLMNQKMQLEAQKYLRNLRRETFVEVR
jgi:peptidyl-prolyl cis-trans isomerase SurA